ncbi:PAS domain S-box protein [Deinococcus sp. PEB2-63]
MTDRAALDEQSLSGALYDITAALTVETSPTTMLRLILEGAQRALNVHHGLAFLNGDQLHAAASHGHFHHLSLTALEELQREAQALTPVASVDHLWPTTPVSGGARLMVPLSADGAFLGALVLERDDDPTFFTPRRQRFLHDLARQGGSAIGRAQRLIALQDSEGRARRLMQDSPVPIATIHMDGALTEANEAYLELLATTRDALARGDVNWITHTPPEYHATDEAAWHQAVNQGSSGPYEKVMLSGTDECIPLEVTLTRAADSPQRHVVGYLRDLRPRRAQEADWQRHIVELQRDLNRQAQALTAQAAELEASTAELTARANVLEGMLALSRDLTGDTRPYQLIERAQ